MIFVVDLDGTFAKNDLFQELLVKQFFNNPISVINCFIKHGVLGLKQFIFKNHEFSYDQILVNDQVLKIIEKKKALGYKILLATASPQVYADYVFDNWNYFSKAIGSSDSCNLKGQAKLDLILSFPDIDFFEYIGDSISDQIIFKRCTTYYKVINNQVYEFTN